MGANVHHGLGGEFGALWQAVWTILMVKNKKITYNNHKFGRNRQKMYKTDKTWPSPKPESFRTQWWHAHCRPNSNNGAKEDDKNGSAGEVGSGKHFSGSVGVLDGVWGDDDVDDKDPQVDVAVWWQQWQ